MTANQPIPLPLRQERSHLALAGVVAVYILLAMAYALITPAWQAPDEPAHYNYVRYLAQHAQLPVLQPGDYPAGLIPLAPDKRPADLTPFRYESHQPPLYYAAAAVVYKLDPSVTALRALGVAFGAALLAVVFMCARAVLPGRPWLQLAAVAVAAFIPMHLAVDASIDNDSLADLVLALLLLAVLARWGWPMVGLLFAAALLTKVTIYLPAALLVLAFAPGRVRTIALAALLSGWWFVRNALTYGWTDPLAQTRQAQVAGGQVHTGALNLAWLRDFAVTTFHSFWGQFGWMSLPLPERDYRALDLLLAVMIIGLVIAGWRWLKPRAWFALGLTAGGAVLSLIVYNLTFVQFQGRYLFPALPAFGITAAVGFCALFPKRLQPIAAGALSLAMLALSVAALQQDLIPGFRA